MAASREDIRGWLKQAEQIKATHLFVVCDTFDHDDHPVYFNGDATEAKIASGKLTNESNMSRLMEVYRTDMDHEAQLKEHRAFNY